MKQSDLGEHDHPQIVAPGIRRVVSTRYGSMLWTLAKLRKPKTCVLCRGPIAAKTKAWSPISFGDWRMERICLNCWPNVEKR